MRKITVEARLTDGLQPFPGYEIDNAYGLLLGMYRKDPKYGSWCVVERHTGLAMAYGDTQKAAIGDLERVISRNGLDTIKKLVDSQLEHINLCSQS